MIRARSVVLVATLILAGMAAAAETGLTPPELALLRARDGARMRRLLEEARSRFQFEGKPIPPSMVQAMEPFWISDGCEPYVLSVDVNMGMDTNRFFQKGVVTRENTDGLAWVRVTDSDDGNAFWRYARVGRLKNGLTLLVLNSDSSASMPAQTRLMAVDFDLVKAQAGDGKPYWRLVMSNRYAAAGFTLQGPVEIKGNTVWAGPPGGRYGTTINR